MSHKWYIRELQRADPLVPPLNLQSALLPIRLVSDIGGKDHFFLTWDIVDDDIEDRLEISSIGFTKS